MLVRGWGAFPSDEGERKLDIEPQRAPQSRLRKLGCSLLCGLLILLLFEGAASVVLFMRDASGVRIAAERRHTDHDPELGWVNQPQAHIPDMYGPNKPLSINAQGFRNRSDFQPQVPPGRVRVVCSGDSFTLGYGVGDDDTWVQLLELGLPGVQTVNMGQGGYGVDQAYLWYLREKEWLEHDLHIFATVATDFPRMESTVFAGTGKPRFQLVDGHLLLGNVPVPAPGWLDRQVQPYLGPLHDLRSVQLISRAKARLGTQSSPGTASTSSGADLGIAVFRALADQHRLAGRPWVWLYLPSIQDRDQPIREMHAYLNSAAQQYGWLCVDLVPELDALSEAEAESLFIAEDIAGYRNATGHYSEAGNRWVAARLQEHLLRMPELVELFAR